MRGGISGSGKSTLVQDVLYLALRKAKGKLGEAPGSLRELKGHELVGDVVMVDQSPIGRTTRANPASYVGAFEAIRKRFALAPLAKERGYLAGTFSFNSGAGRCPTCGGKGFEQVEMQFLSDVYLRCPDCNGRRYRSEVLEVLLDGKSIADVLEMNVSQALTFFADSPGAARTRSARRRRTRVCRFGSAAAELIRGRGATLEACRTHRAIGGAEPAGRQHEFLRDVVSLRRTNHRAAF